MKALTKGRGGIIELERVAEALGRVDVAMVAEVVIRGLEKRAYGQERFCQEKQSVIQMQQSKELGDGEAFVPESDTDRYQYYLTCLKSVIDHEKLLGAQFAHQVDDLNEIKQRFLAFVKSIKDEEALVNGRGRLFTWEELQNDLQLSVSQRINEMTAAGGSFQKVYLKDRPASA